MNMLKTRSYLHYRTCLSIHRIGITLYHASVSSFVLKMEEKTKSSLVPICQKSGFGHQFTSVSKMVNCFVARRNKKGRKREDEMMLALARLTAATCDGDVDSHLLCLAQAPPN